jgi:hypothetical protein
MKTKVIAWWRGLSLRGKAIVVAITTILVLVAGASGDPPSSSNLSVGPTDAPSPSPEVFSPGPTAAAETPRSAAPTSSDSVTAFGSQIRGLTADDVLATLRDRGFVCEGPTTFLDGVDYICDFDEDPLYSFRVEITGLTPSDIRAVEAVFFWFGDKAQLDAGADDFLGLIASLPYEGSSPEEARNWVQSKEEGTTFIGPATFELMTADTGLTRVLEISGS